MSGQVRNFNSRTGNEKVIFTIGRALKGHIDNERRTIFGNFCNFNTYSGPANQALHFYEFQLQSSKSSRQLDNCWVEKQRCEGHSKDDWEYDLE
jgi:hypothetical protein